MQIGSGQFLHGDCLELMREIPDGSVDMVMTSPPYDNLRTYNGMPPFTFDVFRPIADQLARVLKPGGVIVWNVADATVNGSETGSSFRQALYFKDECGLNLHDTMIWRKSTQPLSHNRYEQHFEYMFVFSRGKPNAFNGVRERSIYAGQDKSKRTMRRDLENLSNTGSGKSVGETKLKGNVWDIPAQNVREKTHPATYPLQLPTDHIISWSNPGDLVLDPFAGSGTTAIAAENAGRRWTCMERDPTYYEAAIARVWDHVTCS